jgi:hypothetical protein
MHNITFVNKANFVKVYNNFALKWLIFALYVVVVGASGGHSKDL